MFTNLKPFFTLFQNQTDNSEICLTFENAGLLIANICLAFSGYNKG